MRGIQILTALGEVNERYVEEAEVLDKAVKRHEWTKWAALAACMSLLLAGGAFYMVGQDGGVRKNPPIDSGNSSVGTETDNFCHSYFEECSIVGIRNLYGLPSEFGQDDVGEHYMGVSVSSVYDYRTKDPQLQMEADMEVFQYASNPQGGIYILRNGDSYTPVIRCNVDGSGKAQLKLRGETRPNVIEVRDHVPLHDHVLLPESDVILISGSTAGTKMSILPCAAAGESVTDEEWYAFLSLIESAEAFAPEEAMNPNRKMVGCDMLLVLMDKTGSQIGVALKAFDDGFVNMQIWYEDPEYRYSEYETSVFLRSGLLVERMKELTHWRLIDFAELDSVNAVTCPHAKEEPLSEEERERLIAAVRSSTQEYVDTACPYDVEICFQAEGGETIRALWCNDSCGYLAIEGGVYRLREEDAQYLTELLGN